LISGTSELKLDILKLTARIIIRVPENEKDSNFQRDLFQTSVDFEKFLKGIGGNWVTRGIMADLRSHLDFEPKVPLPKVLILLNQLKAVIVLPDFRAFTI
jgi:hypothetical protein